MKRGWKLPISGLVLATGLVVGCQDSRPAPAKTSVSKSSDEAPVASENASHSPTPAAPKAMPKAPGDVVPVSQNVVGNVEWDLNPPRSVTASMLPKPVDPGKNFKHYCSVCHGMEGRGDGQYFSDELSARPADLTDQKLLDSLTDEHLTSVITKGSISVEKSPLCPPWGRVLSEAQVTELVSYVRTLPKLAAEAPKEGSDAQDEQK